jgi:hypothetical protein
MFLGILKLNVTKMTQKRKNIFFLKCFIYKCYIPARFNFYLILDHFKTSLYNNETSLYLHHICIIYENKKNIDSVKSCEIISFFYLICLARQLICTGPCTFESPSTAWAARVDHESLVGRADVALGWMWSKGRGRPKICSWEKTCRLGLSRWHYEFDCAL